MPASPCVLIPDSLEDTLWINFVVTRPKLALVEIGEGLFGISFKMKGLSGKIKTTINPIKTLTPRFIQKMLEKSKKTK